jgi:MFS family permease
MTVLVLLYSTSTTLVGSFTIYYLLSLGMPYFIAPVFVGLQMAIILVSCFAMGLTRLGRMRGKRLIALAMLPLFLLYLTIGLASQSNLGYVPIIIAVLGSLAGVLYWLPFNCYTLYVTRKGNRATVTSYYSLLWPVVAIFVPVVGGGLIVQFGMWSDVGLASVFLILIAGLVLLSRCLPEISKFDLRSWKALRDFSPKLRMGFALNGMVDGTIWVCTPMLGFMFASSALGYGLFLSAFGIAGALATLMLAFVSDRFQDRKTFLYLGTAFLVPAGLILMVGFDASMYLLILCLINFGTPMLGTLLFVIMGDVSEKGIESAVIARELFLNIGRFIAVMSVLALLLFGHIVLVLLPITAASIAIMFLSRTIKQ